MPNPVLNDKVLAESRAGWAAPTPPSPGGQTWPAPVPGATTPSTSPFGDGPVSPWKGAMTVKGTINATAVLLGLLVAAAVAGWTATKTSALVDEFGRTVVDSDGNVVRVAEFPPIALLGILVGFGCAIALRFKPHLAKILGPVYALGFGFAVGAISRGYESLQKGIVLQAVGATIAVVAVMLVLYRTRIIKVTDRFRRAVVVATLGIMVFYGVSLVIQLFGGSVPYLNEPSALGIGLSVFICLIAALNLALDFDFIEKGTQSGLAKDFEWYAAFGLMVTIVWLYLEILRLLAKLNQR